MEIRSQYARIQACRDLWEAAIQCQLQYEYACPCDPFTNECTAPYLYAFGANAPCRDELVALRTCQSESSDDNLSIEIVGERGTCSYYMDERDPGDCSISCYIPPETRYGAECEGPLSGPVECTCTIRGDTLNDVRRDYSVYGSDCAEAAQALADGKCIDILDCCLSWVDEEGIDQCGCTADLRELNLPMAGREGTLLTCEELASRLNGEVVDRCPSFDTPTISIFDLIGDLLPEP